MEHNEINLILQRRAGPPPCPSNLAERIIHRAQLSVRERPTVQSLWAEFMSMFALPHPAVLTAAGIVLGLLVGIETGDGLFSLQQDWTSFLDINEGGWL